MKEELKERVRTDLVHLDVHFAMKVIKDNIGDSFQASDRLAVFMSLSGLASTQSQLQGIPVLDSGKRQRYPEQQWSS